MPYANISELPSAVRRYLPHHAQQIYRAAFNAAYERYGSVHEPVAHRIAWGAVKQSYRQRRAHVWVPRATRARDLRPLRARGLLPTRS